MKKAIIPILLVLILLSLAACSGSQADSSPSSQTADTPASSAAEAPATEAPATEASAEAQDEQTAGAADGVDVDLTAMSSTMVYSEVLNMQMKPESYLGKTVKMHGPFSITEIGDNRYFACIIADATACCSTGIEFVWAGDHTYPDDYPKENQEITVTGTFTTYMEDGSKYLQLKDADVQF